MLLYELACKKGFNFFATGHYVRIVHEIYGTRINRGIDAKKDQSYYLWRIDQRLLERAICPLGEHYKEDVKESALRIGLGFLTKSKESSGLCFAGEKSYTQLLHQYIDKTNLPGEGIIVDRKGSHIGRHRGYIFYTIGQKKELDLDLKEKLCVAEIDPTRNLIRVDTWQSLYMNSFNIEDCHFFNEEELNSGLPIRTRIRGFGLNPEGNTRIRRIGQNRFKVELEHAAWAIASGQPAVFYSGDKLLGGGIVS
jgi:tRNA-specific 2-thiouridylase